MEILNEARPLWLASGSPRRREIVASLGIPFFVLAASADESTRPGEGPADYLARIARAKRDAASSLGAPKPAGAMLVADTSVIDRGDILGKPGNVDEAEAMIARLAGRAHEVWTHFVIADGAGAGVLHEETVVTRVTFRPLSPARVRAYAESGEGMDKAGGYAVQGRGAGIVQRVEGSYSNVVGLPACELQVALEALGLLP